MNCEEILREYDLIPWLDYFKENNCSLNKEYHNGLHAYDMVERCFVAARFYNLGVDVTKILLLAALFHDFDHSCGMYTDDSRNISKAVVGFNNAYATIFDQFKLYSLTESSKTFIVDIIKATEFPYKSKDEWNDSKAIDAVEQFIGVMQLRDRHWPIMLTMLKAIICDADAMTILDTDKAKVKKQLKGLVIEGKRIAHKSADEILETAKDFYDNYKFRTSWARNYVKAGLWKHASEEALTMLEEICEEMGIKEYGN